eukprot:403357544
MKRVSIKELIPKHKISIDPRRHLLAQQWYNLNDIQDVKFTHREPHNFRDKFALRWIGGLRLFVDALTGKDAQKRDAKTWFNRMVLLESIAPIPGLVVGTAKYFKNLKDMKTDRALVHFMLEESENERTHLYLWLNYQKPKFISRMGIAFKQIAFWNVFFLTYIFSPYVCHRFMGYLEEEAIYNYTMFLKQIDNGNLKELQNEPAPKLAKDYYNLPEDAKFRDMLLALRADEVVHREFNHYFCELQKKDDVDLLNVDDINLDTAHIRFQENPEPTK